LFHYITLNISKIKQDDFWHAPCINKSEAFQRDTVESKRKLKTNQSLLRSEKMKKMVLITLGTMALAGGLFAGGNQEDRDRPFVRGEYQEEMAEIWNDAETVSLTGELAFDRTRVVLKAEGQTYALNIPGARRYIYDLDLQEGTPLTIEGTLLKTEDLPHEPLDDYDGHLFAETVEYDGKVYVLGNNRGRGRMAGGPGMTGGPGKGGRSGGGNRW